MQTKFADVLDAAESLPMDEKEMLVDILKRQMIEERRQMLKSEIEEARHEFETGKAKPATADEITDEILS